MPDLRLSVALASLLLTQAPSLDDVLAKAGQYAAGYVQAFGAIVGEESCVQILRPYGSRNYDMMAAGAVLGEMGIPKVRKMRSEFAVVAVAEESGWMAYRDVVEIDSKPLREERGRLQRILTGNAAGASADARLLTQESLRYNYGSMTREVNVPTFPLMVLMPARQKGFTFVKKGEKRVGDVNAWVIEYTETQRPPLAHAVDGSPKPARGQLWIDPATGRVVKTTVVFDSLDANPDMKAHPERYEEFPRATIEVTYRPDTALGMWIPAEQKESYNRRSEVVTWTVIYSGFHRLDVPSR